MRTRTTAWLVLLCACSSVHRSDASDPNAASEARDGVSRRNGSAGLGAPRPAGDEPADPSDPNEGGQRPPTDPWDRPDPRPGRECVIPAVGPTPLRRLTHFEYDNSVRDLLGDTSAPARGFVPDALTGLFDTDVTAQTITPRLAEQYLDAAIALAQRADLQRLLGCDPGVATCMRGFIASFGRRAYRRPLEPVEVDELLATFAAVSAEADPATGARAVIAALLASPKFVFRPEHGGAASPLPHALQLTAYELAARLASLLWASVPDEELLDAAASGQLEAEQQLEAQARRMLLDARARRAQAAFYEQWFGLPRLREVSKDPALYPAFDAALRDAMAAETRAFVDHVLWEDDARLATLLSASYSFVNAPLAALYGVPAPAGDGLIKFDLDPAQRAGVLTHASVLTAFSGSRHSSPVLRGVWVRERLLCQALPAPPPNTSELPPLGPGLSNRERYEMVTSPAQCRGCHDLVDGLGYGLERYDAIGAYHDTDQGRPIDASGSIASTDDLDGPFDGGPELAARLAGSEHVRDCAATQWLRYALGRSVVDDDTCSRLALQQAFADARGDLQALLIALTQTDAFRSYRQPP